MLLHYIRFDPDHLFNGPGLPQRSPQAEFAVRLYSKRMKKKHNAGRVLSIRLADYFALIKRLVNDDVFVYQHLVAAAITRLKRACAVEEEVDSDELGEIVAAFEDVIWLSRQLIGSTNLPLRDVPLKVYDSEYEHTGAGAWDLEERLVDNDRYPTLGALAERFEEWSYMPFYPQRVQDWGYCLHLERHRPHRMMALPFAKIANSLAEIQNRLEDWPNE